MRLEELEAKSAVARKDMETIESARITLQLRRMGGM